MYWCKSRKHVWTRMEDARKCCNGFKRCLGVTKTEPVATLGGVTYGRMYRYWLRDEAQPMDDAFVPEMVTQ